MFEPRTDLRLRRRPRLKSIAEEARTCRDMTEVAVEYGNSTLTGGSNSWPVSPRPLKPSKVYQRGQRSAKKGKSLPASYSSEYELQG